MANDYTGDNSGDLFRLEMVEEDGFPDVKGVKKIIVSDGSLSDLGNGVVQLATGGGSGGAGGLTTQVQYNKSGNFAGNPGFTYDEITQSVVVGGNVDIGGKLTVAGLIDPTGLELTPQAVNPSNANTLWLDSGNSNKLKQGAVNIIQAGDPISDLLNDVGFVTSATSPVQSVFGRTGVISAVAGDYTTDEVTEGANLYYTDARVQTVISLSDLDDLQNVTITSVADGEALVFDSATTSWVNSALPSAPVSSVFGRTGSITAQSGDYTTSQVTEGSNLYFTNARADARIAAANIDDLNDVVITTPTNGQALTFDSGSGNWVNTALPSAPVTSVNSQTGVVVLDTDDISEGATNLYYTTARFNTDFGTKDTDDLTEGASNLYFTSARASAAAPVQSVNGLTGTVVLSTTAIAEGTNLYFTDARADARIAAADIEDLNDVTVSTPSTGEVLTYSAGVWGNAAVPSAPVDSVNGQTGVVVLDTDDVSEGVSNLYYTTARFDTAFSGKDTDDLSEGATNLYFTNARADARISAADIGDLNDVVITSVADNQALIYDSATSQWKNEVLPSAPVTSVNTLTGAVVLDTDDISEGATNLYYTSARFDASFAGKTTTNLSEGANLYYTTTRFNTDFAASALGSLSDVAITTPSTGQALTFDSGSGNWVNTALPSAPVDSVNGLTGTVVLDTDDISEGATNLYFTNARASAAAPVQSVNGSTGTVVLTTTNISEGTNLYYTDARVDARIAAASIDDLSDVVITTASSGQVLTYNGTNWVNQAVPSAPVTSVNGQTGVVSLASTDLTDTASIVYGGDNVSRLTNDAGYYSSGDNISVGTITTSALANALLYADATGLHSSVSIGSGLSFTGGTLSATGSGGTVTSIDVSGGTTGLTYTGGPITTSGTITMAGTLAVANGGTGATTDSGARTNLGLGAVAVANDTDGVPEGAANLYYTNARVDAQIAAANIDDLNDVVITTASSGQALTYNGTNWVNTTLSSAPVDSVNGQTGVVVLDTDDISEGATNLYYTTARFDTAFSGKDTDDLTEGATNFYYTTARFDASFAGKTTTNLSEGSNLYYTNARADARIAAANIDDLNDVVITTVSSGQALTYNGTNWVNTTLSSAPVDSVNGQTGVVVLDTDDISEGSTNLYYTSARFDASFAGKTTTNLSEGSNLYFTDARADARIAAASIDDLSDVVITTASTNEVLTYNGTNWVNQAVPSAPVTSVNGYTGVVSLASTDLTDTASLIRNGSNISLLTNDSGYTTNTGTVTQIVAGTGLSGGTITTSGTIALANTAVAAGSYTNADITVDAQGRITAASNGSAGGVTSVNGQTGVVSLASTDLTDTASLIRNGSNISLLTNDSAFISTVAVDGVTITGDGTVGNPLVAAGGSGTVTSVGTSAPLTGGTITTSGTIGITQSDTSTDGYLSSTDWNTFNNKLTTVAVDGTTITGDGAGTPLSTTGLTETCMVRLDTSIVNFSPTGAYTKIQSNVIPTGPIWDASPPNPNFDANTGLYTVATAGVYRISWSVAFRFTSSGQTQASRIFVNGNPAAQGAASTTGNWPVPGGSILLSLNPGDTVGLYGFISQAGTNLVGDTTSVGAVYMSINKVSV